jgi:membrane dipeptidase
MFAFAEGRAVADNIAQLMSRTIVWDNHACMPLRPHDVSFLPQLDRCRSSGVDVLTLNVGFDRTSIEDHIRMIASFRKWLAERRDRYVVVDTVQDIRRAKAEGKLAVSFDIEGMGAIGDQLSLVQLYYDLGVRWMLVAYNEVNAAGGGCQQADDPGLTPFGERIVDEMASVGMVTCCSHTGYRTARQVIDRSSNPVIFSHSNARALHDHPRNIPDSLIKACAERGGVVGVNGIGIFLGEPASLVDGAIRQIDHIANLVGAEHVGLGLDYVYDTAELDDYLAAHPQTFPPELGYHSGGGFSMLAPEQIPEIARRLVGLGYANEAIAAILGGNHVRIAEKVWRSS